MHTLAAFITSLHGSVKREVACRVQLIDRDK